MIEPPASSPSPRTSGGFTLIEMLSVMAVMAVMLGLLTSAVNRGSTALVAGGAKVAALVSLAQQRAVSKNTLTALVLLCDQGTPDDYRAFAVVEYNAGRGWTPVTKWESLPVGVAVEPGATCTFLANSPQTFPFLAGPPTQQNPPLAYGGAQVKSQAGYAARIFQPNGGLQNSQAPATIRLVEGVIQNDRVVYTRANGQGGPSNFYDITILGVTGATKVSRPEK
ncbi:MAG: prepilin-type N-terminal cleavage/methylation domain-containing protein [Terrimicrobiaceae bacterium]